SGPHGIIVAPDGGVWYTANFQARLGRLDPANGTIKEYALPATARDPHTPLYYNGAIWFTAQGANLYGSLDPATGQAKLFPVATPRAPTGSRTAARAAATGASGRTNQGRTRSGRPIPRAGARKRWRSPRRARWCGTWRSIRRARGCGSPSRVRNGSAESTWRQPGKGAATGYGVMLNASLVAPFRPGLEASRL